MSYYVLMQRCSSKEKTVTLPLKIFSDYQVAELNLNNQKKELNLLQELLDKHGIAIEHDLPFYYLAEVELDDSLFAKELS